jgi:hypothetical protein
MGRCFEHKEVFPVIIEIIEKLCDETGEARHPRIVEALLMDQQGVVARAASRCPEYTPKEHAKNMVDWVSMRYTTNPYAKTLGSFYKRFDRRDNEGSATYFFRNP